MIIIKSATNVGKQYQRSKNVCFVNNVVKDVIIIKNAKNVVNPYQRRRRLKACFAINVIINNNKWGNN